MTLLAQSILKTLAFFDAQDLPLTLMEIRAYLITPLPLSLSTGGGESLAEIQNTLSSELASKVQYAEGFYFLFGRERLVRLRQERYPISLSRYRKAKKHLLALRIFPYLRAVAISGSLALLNSSRNSDIDLFVLTRKNRIWFVRMLMSLYFHILGKRRHGVRIADRFCLNHYLCEGHEIAQDQNLYTAAEYANLISVLGEKWLEKFWRQNQWVKGYLFSPATPSTSSSFPFRTRKLGRGEVRSLAEFFFEITGMGPLLNYFSGIYQKHRIKMQEYILVSNEELSFHPGSRGQKVLATYLLTLQNLGL